MKALILCAGKGTRLGLKRTPKVMVKVGGKPVLEHLVNHLNKYGINEIIVNISSHSDYTKIFRYFGTRLLYFYEPTLLGEDGTERMLQNWLGNEYVVMNGDTLTNINLAELLSYGRTTFCPNSKAFVKNGRYAGTKVVVKSYRQKPDQWDGDGAYYFDIGTPKKLAKARRYYATHK